MFAGIVTSAVSSPPVAEPSVQTLTEEKPSAATASNSSSVVPVGQPAVGTRSIVAVGVGVGVGVAGVVGDGGAVGAVVYAWVSLCGGREGGRG